jgi:hypothetical protein
VKSIAVLEKEIAAAKLRRIAGDQAVNFVQYSELVLFYHSYAHCQTDSTSIADGDLLVSLKPFKSQTH